ncbi:hypothetical protein F4694_000592 [Bacillus niacini]|uniref:PqqD family protein n=1 Tax=Neobacillus niacini TaxID=86668 RepID=A0A852T5I6_9BACI|nr:hypothetical protein [Neobacillus niacini]
MVEYIRKSTFETVHFDGEVIILNTDNYTLTKLNETGGFCWSLLNESQSVESLRESIFRHFETENNNVQGDIEVFLEGLLECDLIKVID